MTREDKFEKMAIPVANGSYIFVEAQAIEYLISNKDSKGLTTDIYTEDGKKITGYRNIGFFEDLLKNEKFIRVNHQEIVNPLKIEKYEKGVLILKSGKGFEIARRKSEAILKYLRHTHNDEEDTVVAKGFLVIEGKKKQTLPVMSGKQLVGRKSSSKPCDIMIDTEDKTVSRNHFFIVAKEDSKGDYEFNIYIVEPKNKTTVDKKQLEVNIGYSLKDGAVIKVGETVIVFKTA